MDKPRPVRTSSTAASNRWRGRRSAMAPEKRARKFMPMRAEAMRPTRKGLPVTSRMYQESTSASIWLPVWTDQTEDHTRAEVTLSQDGYGVGGLADGGVQSHESWPRRRVGLPAAKGTAG